MSDPNSFSTKEIVIDIQHKLDKFIDKVEIDHKQHDHRLDTLESFKESHNSVIRFAAWIIGSLGGVGVIYLFLNSVMR
jgi:hypothetical protein